MKNTKRFIALLTAATMVLAPMSVSANTSSSTGNGVMEADQSKIPTFANFSLPTIPNGTYDFTLDPSKLLNEYEPENYPDANATAYFTSLGTPASVKMKESSVDSQASIGYKAKTSASISGDFSKVMAATKGAESNTINTVTSGYFLWVPKGTNGEGEYKEITTSNVNTYFKVDDSLSIDYKNTKVAPSVCDGDIYEEKVVALPATYTVTDNSGKATIDGVSEQLYYATSLPAKVATAATTSDLTFKKAENAHTDTSDKLTIVNKSTSDYKVTATVTVNSADGLEFYGNSSYSGTGAAISVKISGGASDAYAASGVVSGATVVTGSITIDVASAGATYNEWRSETNDNQNTGGHTYYKYEQLGATYTEVDFTITAKAHDGNPDAWKEYAETLKGAATRPNISVVYTMEKVGDDAGEEEVDVADLGGVVWHSGTVDFNAPTGLTSISAVAVSTDGSTYTPLASANYLLYDLDGTQTLWVKHSSDSASHVYIKVEGNSGTYIITLW